MYLTIAVVLVAVVSVAFGYSIKQLAYGQANMTGENMTVSSSNMTATDDTSTNAVPTPEVLMQKLNSALDDVLGKVRQQDPDAKLSKVECHY